MTVAEMAAEVHELREEKKRLRAALFVLNARFHSVCNGIGPHVHTLYLDDLAEVRAILSTPDPLEEKL